MSTETVEERLIKAMEFGQQTYISDKLIQADTEFDVMRDVAIRGWQAIARLTVAGAEVREVTKEWSTEFDKYGEYLPRWQQWLRRMVPKRFRPVTVHHYHVCPHIEPPEAHLEFLTHDDSNT